MTWSERLGRLRTGTVDAAAACWGARHPTLVSAGFNLVYRTEYPGGVLYQRFTHADWRDAAYLGPPLAWLRHLHARGAPVNEPLASLNGHWIEAAAQGGDHFLVTAVRGVAGPRLSERPPDPDL